MNIAEAFPARRDGERVWFRPAEGGGVGMGWTSDPAMAHADYRVVIGENGGAASWVGPPVPWVDDTIIVPVDPDLTLPEIRVNGIGVSWPNPTPTMEEPMTVDTTFDDPDVVAQGRTTPTMGYPLPPEAPRARIVYDGWGRYKLPSPTTGRPTAFTRSTTVAGTLDDTYHLSRWKQREIVKHVLQFTGHIPMPDNVPAAAMSVEEREEIVQRLLAAYAEDSTSKIHGVLDGIDNTSGGRDAAELGQAVHAWLEAIDLGLVLLWQVPKMFQPYVVSYQNLLRRYGLVAVPIYVERIVLNDRGEQTIAGTLDRIYLVVATGELILGDVKTSKTLDFGYLEYAVQLAVYGYAPWILKVDGSGWEPMPEINQEFAIIMHIPSNEPERSDAVTFDLWWGGEAMICSLEARRRRSEAKKKVPFIHPVPIPTPESLRYVEARQALQNIVDQDQLTPIYEQYEDVWTDDLTELGLQLAELIPASATAVAPVK